MVNQWHTTVFIGGGAVKFKIDTGAQVTAISERTYKRLRLGPLKRPSKTLFGPAYQSLETLGQVPARLTHGQMMTKQTLFVVKGLHQNLLGLLAVTSVHLIHRGGGGGGGGNGEPGQPPVAVPRNLLWSRDVRRRVPHSINPLYPIVHISISPRQYDNNAFRHCFQWLTTQS